MAPGNRKAPTRANSSESQFSLMEFMQGFPDDDACLTFLWRSRYSQDGETALCPHCEIPRTFKHYAEARQAWTCVACGHRIYVTAGTIFHKSSTSLHLWFYAMYLMSSTRCGISAKQLERELGVTYKTAWRMFTLIRNELMTQDGDVTLSRQVEMDEMYVGGKPRLADKASYANDPAGRQAGAIRWARENKTGVFGMVERPAKVYVDGKAKPVRTRPGKVVAHVIPKNPQKAIVGHIANHVADDAVVYTDDARIYDRLSKDGYDHRAINHSEGVYVSGSVHTSTIEGFWSLVKRGISGVNHAVSPKYLQGYLNEYVWRYNHRDDPRAMFALLALRAARPTF